MSLPSPVARGIDLQVHRPVTFVERGAWVPFTSPALVGARVRPGDRGTLELIVPNPSGLRGVYILPWGAVRDLYRPTVHDSKLAETIALLPAISPRAICQAARAVAIQGWAGRDVAAAARRANDADQHAQLVTNFQLLLRLVAQVEPGSTLMDYTRETLPEAAELRIRAALAVVAARIGRGTELLGKDLEDCSGLLAACGVNDGAAHARVYATLEALARLRNDLTSWASEESDECYSLSRMIAAAADLMLACAASIVQSACAQTSDVVQLLVGWNADADAVAHVITRPEWLLDGWEQIALVWRDAASPAQRRAALGEMASLVPVIPKQAATWAALDLDMEQPEWLRRHIPINQDWRSGVPVSDMVARNERRRASA